MIIVKNFFQHKTFEAVYLCFLLFYVRLMFWSRAEAVKRYADFNLASRSSEDQKLIVEMLFVSSRTQCLLACLRQHTCSSAGSSDCQLNQIKSRDKLVV